MKGIALAIMLMLALKLPSTAQNLRSTTFTVLQQRFENGHDTTYVVNFWATWCAPCIKEIPNFDKLQQNYKNHPIKVILLSVDFPSQIKKVNEFLAQKNFQSEVYLIAKNSDQEFIEQVSKDWEGAIPATLFVNNKKKLWQFYQREFSYEELEQTYQSLK